MTPSVFFFMVANHLWQSTVFVVATGLLAYVLKRNHARTRYWIWWFASMKFVVPFSLLVVLGGQVSWRSAPASLVESPVPAFVIEQVAQPFTSEGILARFPIPVDTTSNEPVNAVSMMVGAIWILGTALVFSRWVYQWRRARAAVTAGGTRQVVVLTAGRELEALRRLEQRVGANCALSIVSSAAAIEPSVFGLRRPVLVWPAGLSERLRDEELDAILLHEISHALRRDNATAFLHMIIQAVFWFHPLVWWLGARLVDERERACDEDVLRWGGASRLYAEGILKVCEYCLESPVFCAAGVTGSNLKKRIENILQGRVALRLTLGRAVLVAATAISAIAGPIAIGVLNASSGESEGFAPVEFAQQPVKAAKALDETREQLALASLSSTAPVSVPRTPFAVPQNPNAVRATFDVISIRQSSGAPAGVGRGGGGGQRGGGGGSAGPMPCGGMLQINPGRFVATNVTLYRLITIAYGKHCRLYTEQSLITGGPDWRESIAFDIQATIPEGTPTYTTQQFQNGEAAVLQAMVRNMIEDRFKLALHRDTKEVPVYNLTIVKLVKMKLADDQTPPPPPTPPTGPPTPGIPFVLPRGAFSVGVDPPKGKVTIEATGMPISNLINNMLQGGVGRMVVDKTEQKGLFDIPKVELDVGPYDIAPGAVTVWPEILSQLGMKMEASKGPAELLVIDRAEKPSEN